MHRHFLSYNIFKRWVGSEGLKTVTPPHVDTKKKVVYGGDLPVPTSTKSFGRLMFERLRGNDRPNAVLQVEKDSGVEVTTKEYLKLSVAVAEKLKESGVKKGDFVTLVGNNSLNMNLTLTGTLFAGAVAVPLSQKNQYDEFKLLIEATKPKVIACDKKYLYSFIRIVHQIYGNENFKIFLLSNTKHPKEKGIESFMEFVSGHGLNVEAFQPTDVENSKDELALVLKALTDGALGRAVGITHHNLNSIVARFDSKDVKELKSDVVLMAQRVMWLSGLYSLIQSCCYGSKLVIMEEYDTEEFLKAIEKFKVTSSIIYFSKLWQLYKHEHSRKYDLSSCRIIQVVDDCIPQWMNKEMKKIGIRVEPVYGMHELTGVVLESVGVIKNGCKFATRLVPQVYGKVISEYTYQNVGPNEKGEICFMGPIASKGYINDSKATQMLYDKAGYLQSGCYGFYDEDGHFFILDAIYYVINYKDYKISPKELETIIKDLKEVKDVAVAGIKHQKDGFCPIAFVVPEKGVKLTEEMVLKYVQDRVPDWKRLRGGVVFLKRIPRFKDNGKIKRALFKQILTRYQLKVVPESRHVFEDKKEESQHKMSSKNEEQLISELKMSCREEKVKLKTQSPCKGGKCGSDSQGPCKGGKCGSEPQPPVKDEKDK